MEEAVSGQGERKYRTGVEQGHRGPLVWEKREDSMEKGNVAGETRISSGRIQLFSQPVFQIPIDRIYALEFTYRFFELRGKFDASQLQGLL